MPGAHLIAATRSAEYPVVDSARAAPPEPACTVPFLLKEITMYSTTCLLALHLLGVGSLSPSWNLDYGQALKRAEATNKPVAVFIGSGSDGWKAISEEGNLSPEVRRLLRDHYICLYIDAGKAADKNLVRSFEADQLPMVVLSTTNRAYQAYRHSGTTASADLAQALRRYASEDSSPKVVSYEAPCRT
jgi:hypothetical protein